MLKYCLKKWDKNNDLLRKKLESDKELNSCGYEYLVKLVVDIILNGDEKDAYSCDSFDSSRINKIDNGDYQGTLIFLIPTKEYQPSESSYLMTFVGYGSCSACDTLQAIQDWSDNPPSENQLKDYMSLCKDLVCNIVKPYNTGWRKNEDFDPVEY